MSELNSLKYFINRTGAYRGFEKDYQGTYEIKLKGPVLYLVGAYKISGRVLILPVQGEGKSNMTLGTSAMPLNIRNI